MAVRKAAGSLSVRLRSFPLERGQGIPKKSFQTEFSVDRRAASVACEGLDAAGEGKQAGCDHTGRRRGRGAARSLCAVESGLPSVNRCGRGEPVFIPPAMDVFGFLCVALLCAVAARAKPTLRKERVHHETDLSGRTQEDNKSFQYDHEAFLGKEVARTFDQLTPEESKDRLG